MRRRNIDISERYLAHRAEHGIAESIELTARDMRLEIKDVREVLGFSRALKIFKGN